MGVSKLKELMKYILQWPFFYSTINKRLRRSHIGFSSFSVEFPEPSYSHSLSFSLSQIIIPQNNSRLLMNLWIINWEWHKFLVPKPRHRTIWKVENKIKKPRLYSRDSDLVGGKWAPSICRFAKLSRWF